MLAYKRFFNFNNDFRDPFSRDRDRVIHSSSFRRLEYKTQVFVNHEGDYFRTRLTHSLEVAQIARTLSRELKLNETLAETIALSHDLGHTPFGHTGGDELDRLLKIDGFQNGFEHNFQSFRVLTKLEKRYKNFDGLNLTYATLEGVLKHSTPYKKSFFPKEIIDNFNLDYHPSLEAIVVDYADAIAYTTSDIDDGIKYNLISYKDLKECQLIKIAATEVKKEGIKPKEHIFRHRLVASLIKILVEDFINNSKEFVSCNNKEPLCSFFKADTKLDIGHSKDIAKALKELKKVLFKKMYRHSEIVKHMHAGKICVKALYSAYSNDTNLLPTYQQELLDIRAKHRVIADYIASMTDRFALKSYHEIYGIKV
jgi:dGTPase